MKIMEQINKSQSSDDEFSSLLKERVNNGQRILKTWEKLTFGLGNAFNDLTAMMWFSYLLLFLQIILKVPAATAGFLIFFGQIVDGLCTPILGVVTDKYLTRKLWYCIGVSIIFINFPLIFTFCPFCGVNYFWMILYFCITIALFQIGWAMVQISHLSMIPDIPGPDSQRAELTTIRYTVSVLASVCFYLITWSEIHFRDGNKKTVGPSDRYKFMDIALIVTGLGGICSIFFYLGMKRYQEGFYKNNKCPSLTVPKVCKIFLTPVIYQVSMLYVASRLLLTLNLIYMPLFLDERQAFLPPNSTVSQEASAENLASVPLISYVSSFVISLVLKYYVDRFGNKSAYFIGCLIGLLGCFWINLMDIESGYGHIYFSAILLGAGSAITLVTSLSLTADFIGSNTEQGAFVYSVVTFADKVLTGVAVLIIEQLKCESQEMCPEYYHYTFVYTCGGSCIFGCVILLTLIPTNFTESCF